MHLTYRFRDPIVPHKDVVKVRMERWWLPPIWWDEYRYADGWTCRISGQGISVADWGKNQVQALRNAKALYKKLFEEKHKRLWYGF